MQTIQVTPGLKFSITFLSYNYAGKDVYETRVYKAVKRNPSGSWKLEGEHGGFCTAKPEFFENPKMTYRVILEAESAPKRKAPKKYLSDKSVSELQQIRQQITSDPKSKNIDANPFYIYGKSARKKLEAIDRAIFSVTTRERLERGEYVNEAGYSGRKSNRN